ncbi:MAG: Fic-DOC domain mobile mystery protein B [Bermanella sp.]|jgi:Fic-DOC domain mobile mystery protein B
MIGKEPDGATPLSSDEAEGLLHKHVSTRGQLNELEQANIVSEIQWLNRPRQRNAELDDRFLREVHKKLFGVVWSRAGQYRKTEKNIGVDPLQIAVDIRKLCDDAIAWVEYQTYPLLEAAARLHHRMVTVHPFPNGNGRHARIVAD